MNTNPAHALQVLSDVTAQHLNQISNHASNAAVSSDDDEERENQISDSFYAEGGSHAIHGMTNFTSTELLDLWVVIEDHVRRHWNTGRGKRCKFTPYDMPFMTLTVLKHGQQWGFTARLFGINVSTFERAVVGFLKVISDFMYENFVARVEERWAMAKCRKEQRLFSNFDYARYATDVSFQQCSRPVGTVAEGKIFYSGKHHLYGYKVEVSVLPIGLAIGATKHFPGSVADVEIFRRNHSFHSEASKKVVADLNHEDGGLLEHHRHDCWAILADKGYQGAADDLRVIIPLRTPARAVLSAADQRYNAEVSSDRVIVENFFGRMSGLWTIMAHKWRWNEDIYDVVLRTCVALTNCHIKAHLLREADSVHFNGIRNRLRAISDGQDAAKMRANERRMARRRELMANSTPRRIFDDEDSE